MPSTTSRIANPVRLIEVTYPEVLSTGSLRADFLDTGLS